VSDGLADAVVDEAANDGSPFVPLLAIIAVKAAAPAAANARVMNRRRVVKPGVPGSWCRCP
jgi:hypothetical protein